MRVGFYTLGCKVNQYETEAMKEKFISAGHEIVGSLGEIETAENSDDKVSDESKGNNAAVPADAYVINTCTVTNMADRKSRQFIRRAKKMNPDSIIAVVGCYAQVDPEAVSKIDGVDIILGTNEKSKIVEAIEGTAKEKAQEKNAFGRGSTIYSTDQKEPLVDVLDKSALSEYKSDGVITAMESRTRAYIKIQEGCDRFCTYCIIPTARGPVRSRDEEEIVEEARGLVNAGFKEIVLTGINTALYGCGQSSYVADDTDGTPPLRSLLDKLTEISGEFRIRLSSLEPNVVSPDDIMKIVGAEKLCHHLHLSIQSGSNKILRAMNRHYTREDYLDIVKALKSFDPHFGITTDIIVGFPGETEEDFQNSISLVQEAGLSRVHVFPYSPRKGTVAAEMENQISSEEKKRRAKVLSESAEHVADEFCERLVGNSMMGLFEETHDDYMTGYADNYIRIYAPTQEDLINKLVLTKIVGIQKDGVTVEIR